MSFDVNFNQKPIIQGAQSAQDGGAGNLGYFEQGASGEGHQKNKSIFDEEVDTFKKSDQEPDSSEDFSIAKFIAKLILAVKDWFKKLFKLV